jgi:hypothetical protein
VSRCLFRLCAPPQMRGPPLCLPLFVTHVSPACHLRVTCVSFACCQVLKGVGLGLAVVGVLFIGKPESKYKWSSSRKLRTVVAAVARFKRSGDVGGRRIVYDVHSPVGDSESKGATLVRSSTRAVHPGDLAVSDPLTQP